MAPWWCSNATTRRDLTSMVAQNSIGAPLASATSRVRPWCATSTHVAGKPALSKNALAFSRSSSLKTRMPTRSACGSPRALENEAVMTRLGDAAQIERIVVFIADDEAEEVNVEVPAHRQVLHGEHRVARARDVEGRIVDGLRNAHGALQSKMSNRTQF